MTVPTPTISDIVVGSVEMKVLEQQTLNFFHTNILFSCGKDACMVFFVNYFIRLYVKYPVRIGRYMGHCFICLHCIYFTSFTQTHIPGRIDQLDLIRYNTFYQLLRIIFTPVYAYDHFIHNRQNRRNGFHYRIIIFLRIPYNSNPRNFHSELLIVQRTEIILT